MAGANIQFGVTDPALLIAGLDPNAPFVVTYVQIYRWATESLARAGNTGSGTLATTFTLIAPDQPRTDTAGPFAFAAYDAGQGAASWYRARYASSDLLSLSQFSIPWQSDERDQWTLRDLLPEVSKLLGPAQLKFGTAEANAVTNKILCARLWKSTVFDDQLHHGHYAMVLYDAGAANAAPEGEEAIIDSADGTSGLATLDRALTAAVTTGDVFAVSPMLPVTEVINAINLAREEMRHVVTQDIALRADTDRYPAPVGIRRKTDVLDCVGVTLHTADSQREQYFDLPFEVEFDGFKGWILLSELPGVSQIARLRYERSFRSEEGNLISLNDATSAPIEWLRTAAAWKVAEYLYRDDTTIPEFAALEGALREAATMQSRQYAPSIVRRLTASSGGRRLPGPVEVA